MRRRLRLVWLALTANAYEVEVSVDLIEDIRAGKRDARRA